MEYNHKEIEEKWQKRWAENKTFKADNQSTKPKYYVLDMFPYPSGAGLHVGHPLGYIASDIFARFKRHKGFNVLHPMGYDAFGLPAEQYAIETGQHPALTTEKNIARYREQLDKIGFSFDWDREFKTSDPAYYRWTQWIFAQLFNSWYNKKSNKAQAISELIALFEKEGNFNVSAACDEDYTEFTADQWRSWSKQEQSAILMQYRLAYQKFTAVNWCPALGTVLANDEVKDGVSERGGHPVERKMMRQWSLRITAYADRLLQGLDTIDWPESIKEIQRNWIGRSEGASIQFRVAPHDSVSPVANIFPVGEPNAETGFYVGGGEIIEVFTTRPDTIFGVSFVTLAPEHELVNRITTPEQKEAVEEYVNWAKNRSERERMSEVKKVSGVFTGAFVFHPFTGSKVPVWIGDYVLAGYGTGAVMAVPSGDQRDWNFANHFNIQIIPLLEGQDCSEGADESKDKKMINSGFLNGLTGKEAIPVAIKAIEEKRIGKGKVNFKLRDAGFSRQRYWGEPFPIIYKDGIPELLPFGQYPTLPDVKTYQPTGTGEGPLASVQDWVHVTFEDGKQVCKRETDTMPGYAGSSWYYLRYMDSKNETEFVSKDAATYWKEVDLYIGGSEHATGHLMYVRFWTKFLKDLGYLNIDEPAKKLINQGMIQGRTSFVYQVFFVNMTTDFTHPIFVSKGIYDQFQKNMDPEWLIQLINKKLNLSISLSDFPKAVVGINAPRVDVKYVKNDELDIEGFKQWREDYSQAQFVLENGKYICGYEVEKMSKSKYNVVNPDDIVLDYGADTLRLYEMFLGPLEQSKPWNTNGITGVSGFLKKLWRLYLPLMEGKEESQEPTKAELKTLHKTIKKVQEDIERFSFNTSVSNFMICVNELSEAKCSNRSILEPLLVLLSPYAPHITEELWERLGHSSTIAFEPFPEFNPAFLEDNTFNYPVSFNGKTRFNLELPVGLSNAEIEKAVLEHAESVKWTEGKTPKKVIVVPKKIVNVVI
ncbi:MAG: leucine--tRNA ligase [Bacteroidia bacterium]|nr:leucine--tRNA ligase [Bacteroidia bacterium]